MNRGLIGALSLSVAIALLAGCGGSQPPIGASVAPPGAAAKARAHQTTSGALIYAGDGCDGICVLSYPQGQIIGSIHATGHFGGLCSDADGNVFVTNGTHVLEYIHGGTSPVATLTLPGTDAHGCAVDPTTHNLAVIFESNTGDIAVFPNESGSPNVYTSTIDSHYCGYDSAGNLFVSGWVGQVPAISEIAHGQQTATVLSISGSLGHPGQIQWDGANMTYENLTPNYISISQLGISGSVATALGTTTFKNKLKFTTQSWIFSGNILVPYGKKAAKTNKLGHWPYPNGGKAKSMLKFANSGSWAFQGVTVSVAPSR